jgi:hypothetical protein
MKVRFMNIRNIFIFLFVAVTILSACYPVNVKLTPSAVSTQQPVTTITQISEEALIGTEQAMAMTVQAEGALTRAAQPTQTSILAHLPTLTPIPNSTPAQKGAFFDVSPDILGSRYEIENACYFDTQSGWERYEIYAGAIAGSGDEYSAQGVAVVRVLRVVEKDGKPNVELAETKEYLTVQKEGPLHLPLWDECPNDWMHLRTPLNFGWVLHPGYGDFYEDRHSIPLARIESGGKTQLAETGSYCWYNSCADGGAIGTSSVPLTTQSSMTIYLRLPLDESPDNLGMDIMKPDHCSQRRMAHPVPLSRFTSLARRG